MEKCKFNIWKNIREYTNYCVGLDGEIRSLENNISLKQQTRKRGYKYIYLYNASGGHKFYTHRLVAKAFIPNGLNKPMVNHKDSNPSNNNVQNLEWCTASENNLHANRYGNKGIVKSNLGNFGAKSFNSKAVILTYDNGLTEEFACGKEASEALGMNYRYITGSARAGRYIKRTKATIKYKSNE